jgi:hypothetical protein
MPNAGSKNKMRAIQPIELALGPAQSSEVPPAGLSQLADATSAGAPRSPVPSGLTRTFPNPSQSSQLRGLSPTELSPPPGSGPGPTEEGEPLGEDERRSSLKELESFIARHRDCQISKTMTLAGIVSIIVRLSIPESEKDQTIKLFGVELESVQHGSIDPDLPLRGRE